MVTLTSNCCGAQDRLFKRVLDMNYSEMGICPRCGEHCDFENWELIRELQKAATGKDLISVTIRKAIDDKASHMEIFAYIKSEAKDNQQMMAGVISQELTTKILSL